MTDDPEGTDFETDAEQVIRLSYSALGSAGRLVRSGAALVYRRERRRAAQKQIAAHRARVRRCPGCEQLFQGGSVLAVYCSDRCRKRISRGYKQTLIVCQECECSFTTTRNDARFCSAACRSVAWRKSR